MGRKKRNQRTAQGHGYVYLPKQGGKIASHIYRARWTVDGKVYTRTTGTTDKREAEKALAEFTHPFQAQTSLERLEAQRAQMETVKGQIEAWKDAQPATAIKAAFDEYRRSNSRPNRADESTMDRYESQFGELAKWLAVKYPDVQELRQVTPEMADAFIRELREKATPNTVNKRITLFRSLWTHLAKSARLTANPWQAIRKLELTTYTRRELTVDELRRVCEPLTGEMRLLFAVGIYSGLRLADAAQLDWGAVDLARGIISIIPHKTRKHANGKRTLIPIHSTLGAMLAETEPKKRRGFVMPEIAELSAHNEPLLSKRIQRHFEECGVKTQGVDSISGRAQVDVGFHSLRHTFVSLSANAGVPIALVQAIVGHSNPAMTAHYFHESETALKDAVRALPAIPMNAATAGTRKNAATGAPTATPTTTPENGADAAEGRFSAFCAIVAKMDAGELERAAAHIASLRQGAK